MPTIGIEGGRINIVPVDFVVDAMDHIAHKPGLDGKCFHLVDPATRTGSARCSTSSPRRPRPADDACASTPACSPSCPRRRRMA
jgi:hypothetical protein